MSEALIFRYFGGKRGLLHQILSDGMLELLDSTLARRNERKDEVEQLKDLINECLTHYNRDCVFVRALFVESRNFPGFFESETYRLVQQFYRLFLDIIRQGMEKGEIRNDISPEKICSVIFGCLEYFSLPKALFGKNIHTLEDTDCIMSILVHGITPKIITPCKPGSKESDEA